MTQLEIAKQLDLSERKLREFLKSKDLDHKKNSLDEIRIAYIKKLRDSAAGRSNKNIDDAKLELVNAQIREKNKRIELIDFDLETKKSKNNLEDMKKKTEQERNYCNRLKIKAEDLKRQIEDLKNELNELDKKWVNRTQARAGKSSNVDVNKKLKPSSLPYIAVDH